jgi:PAS domain S-box-containing protein
MSEKQHQAIAEAVNTNTFLNTVAPCLPLAVIAWDHNNHTLHWNKASEELFGYTFEQTRGQTLETLLGCHISLDIQPDADSPNGLLPEPISCKHASGQTVHTCWRLLPASLSSETGIFHIAIIDNISEQIKQEYERKLAAQSFYELTEYMSDYVYIHDLQGNFTSINESIACALGYSKDECLNLNIKDIVAPSFYDAIKAKMQEKISGKARSSHYEIMVRKKDGEEIWIEISNRLIYVDNKPAAVQGIARNIEDRKKYQLEVERSEQKFRRLFETIDDIYYHLDIASNIDLVSPSAYTHLGYRTEELLNMKIEDLYAVPEKRSEVLATLLEHGRINDYEIDLRHKNNIIVPFSVSARVVYDEKGQAQGIEGIARNISQRKEHEKILETNEQRFRRIFESIQDVYFRAENTIVMFVSPSCKSLLGYTPEEMIGHHTEEFYNNSSERNRMIELFRRQGYLTDYEIDYRHKNGSPITCSLNLNAVRNGDGKIVAVEGTLRDITMRKEAEQALRSSEQRFRRIFESFQDLYYEADMNGIVTVLSPSVETLYGYKPSDLIGKPATVVYADPKQREELFTALAEKGYVNDYELMLVNKKGEIKPTSCSTRLVFDEHGKPVAVQGVLRDITQRKKSDAALRESEARFRSIFNSIPDAFLEINKFNTIVNASPSVAQFSYHPDRLIGADISALFKDRKDWDNISRWLKAHNEIQHYESILKIRDGQSIPVSITAYKISSEQDTTYNLIFIIRDVSDSKRYEQELELARDQALEASRAKSSFLANMSHELRTPLNAVIGYSEMLAEDADNEGKQEISADLKKIHASGLHLLSVISDILDLSKIEAGKVELNMEKIGIAEFVNDLMVTIAPLARKNNNTLNHQCALNGKDMIADPVRLKQALLNLLGNACKFTRDGVINLDVYTQSDKQGEWIYFSIKDSGIGITEMQMQKLFSEFSQADSTTTRKFGGTGLGLVISQRFCQLMGGKIQAESTYGEGSVFTVKLPIRQKTTH